MTVGLSIKVEQSGTAIQSLQPAQLKATEQSLGNQVKLVNQATSGMKQFGAEAARATATIAGGLKTATASLGASITQSLSSALNGGLLNGNLFRAGGGLVSAVGKIGGQLGSTLTLGIGQALSGAASTIGGFFGSSGKLIGQIAENLTSGVASAFGAALSVAGSLAGTLASAAGEIAGFIGDKIGTALKITLGAGASVAFAGLARAIDVDKLTPQFTKFAEASGTTVPEALGKLQSSVGGAVSKIDLMRTTNLALTLGVSTSVDELADYAGKIVDLGDAVGKEGTESLEAFVRGVAGLQERTLRSIGLTVDFKAALEASAKAMDRNVDSLTESERVYIALRTALQAVDKATAGNKTTTSDLNKKWDSFKATLSDFITGVADKLAPAFSTALTVLQPLVDGIAKFLNRNTAGLAETLAKSVGGLAKGLQDAGKFIGNVKLDELFQLAKLAADELWIRFKQGAEIASKFVVDQMHAAFLEVKAFAIETLAESFAAVLAPVALLDKSGKTSKRISDVIGGARSDELRSQAGGLRSRSLNQKGFIDTPELQAIREKRSSIINDINSRRDSSGSGGGGDPLTAAASHIDAAATKLDEAVKGVPRLSANQQSAADQIAALTGRPFRGSSAPSAPPPGPVILPPSPLTEHIVGKHFAVDAPTPQAPGGLQGRQSFFGQQLRQTVTTNFQNLDPAAIATLAKLFAAASQSAATFTTATDHLLESSNRLEADAAIEARKRDLHDEESKLHSLENIRDNAYARKEAFFNDELALAEREFKAKKKIADDYDKAVAQATENAKSILSQAFNQKLGSLTSGVGGFEADDGIPLKAKASAARTRRHANQARKHDLNQALAGKGLTELSDNGGAELQQILAQQAGRESSGALQEALQAGLEEIGKASEAKAEAEAKLADEVATQTDKLQSAFDREEELLQSVLDQIKSQASVIEKHEATLKDFERVVSALRSNG